MNIPMPNPGRADKASGWWPFKKKISQPIFAIVDAINNGEFDVCQKQGILQLVHNKYNLVLEFWAGRMMDNEWCTEDELELITKTAHKYRLKLIDIENQKKRQSFMKLIKEN